MKASVNMIDSCGDAKECGHPIFFVFIAVWVITSVATLWWLRRVFARYETTQALPVEYGAVNAVGVCSGLIFYREANRMAPWQLLVTLVGVLAILTGIGIGRIESGDDTAAAAAAPAAAAPAAAATIAAAAAAAAAADERLSSAEQNRDMGGVDTRTTATATATELELETMAKSGAICGAAK